MSEAWFFHAALPSVGERVMLDAEEAHHAMKVRRLSVDDRVTLFDGCGGSARCRITQAAKKQVEVEALERRADPPPTPRVTIASAMPKGDRQGVMVSMLTQLGMSVLMPLRCEHSVVTAGRNFAERAQRIMVETCKQARRAHLPEVRGEIAPVDAAREASALGERVWLTDPQGVAWREALRVQDPPAALAHCMLIGPEAGFSAAERDAMIAAGAQPVAMTASILRVETAAVAACAVVMMTMAE